MKTISIQIGNSDDKLTQAEWSQFVARVGSYVRAAGHIHFFACSGGECPWQNAAWIVVCDSDYIEKLKRELSELRVIFKQESVAWMEGETQFV